MSPRASKNRKSCSLRTCTSKQIHAQTRRCSHTYAFLHQNFIIAKVADRLGLDDSCTVSAQHSIAALKSSTVKSGAEVVCTVTLKDGQGKQRLTGGQGKLLAVYVLEKGEEEKGGQALNMVQYQQLQQQEHKGEAGAAGAVVSRAEAAAAAGGGGEEKESPAGVLLTDNGDGKYTLAFAAGKAGTYAVRVTLTEQDITGSPLQLRVEPEIDPIVVPSPEPDVVITKPDVEQVSACETPTSESRLKAHTHL